MRSWNKKIRILGIGAHFDDVELNALGTLLRAKEHYDAELHLIVCTDSANSGGKETRLVEQQEANHQIGYKSTTCLNGSDGLLSHSAFLVSTLENHIDKIDPDLIITHSEQDFHQDHVSVARAVRAVNRYSRYSILSFASQDPKQPFLSNLHIDITDFFDDKLNLLKCYKSQQDKPWFNEQTIKSRNAGIGDMQYAEKFYVEYMKL